MAGLGLWIEGFGDLVEDVSAFGGRLACGLLAWERCLDMLGANLESRLAMGKWTSSIILSGTVSVRHFVVRVVAFIILDINIDNLSILKIPACNF